MVVLTSDVVGSRGDEGLRTRRTGPVVSRRLGIGVVATATAVVVALLGVAAAVAAGPPPTAPGGHTQLAARDVGGVTVLTSAQGRTLYWFSLDTPTTSRCTGTCTAYWPPITGSATLAAGIAGTVTTVDRSGDVEQPAYDGHPLYTYVGDSGPGQATGNGLHLNGGIWHEVTVSR